MHVVFVHGIGVRPVELATTLRAVAGRLGDAPLNLSSDRMTGVDWGAPYGARLNCAGTSIPGFTSSGGSPPLPDWTIYLWEQLKRDPHYEFNILNSVRRVQLLEPSLSLESSEGAVLFNSMIAVARATHDEDTAIGAVLRQHCIAESFAESIEAVQSDEDVRLILCHASGPLTPYRDALARMLLATALGVYETKQGAPSQLQLSRSARLAVEELVASSLAPDEMGPIADIVKDSIVALAKRLGTNYLMSRRGSLSEHAVRILGDLLVYQVRGNLIRRHVLQSIAEVKDDVVLIGHSLGGTAAVELLLEGLAPRVVALITVGSQAGFFYEINALSASPFRAVLPENRLPPSFPPWLNAFDDADLLSYLASPIFGTRVKDVRIDSGLAFPDSHSAYWFNDHFWAALLEFVGQCRHRH